MRQAALLAVALASLALAGSACAGQDGQDAGPGGASNGSEASPSDPAPDAAALEAARVEAYASGNVSCSESSISDFVAAHGYGGKTASAIAAEWSISWDTRLRDAAYRGCRDALAETISALGDAAWDTVEPPPATQSQIPATELAPAPTRDERQVYIAEYATCSRVGEAAIGRDYGFDTQGKTRAEIVREMERQTYRPELQQVAIEACLHAMNDLPARYR